MSTSETSNEIIDYYLDALLLLNDTHKQVEAIQEKLSNIRFDLEESIEALEETGPSLYKEMVLNLPKEGPAKLNIPKGGPTSHPMQYETYKPMNEARASCRAFIESLRDAASKFSDSLPFVDSKLEVSTRGLRDIKASGIDKGRANRF